MRFSSMLKLASAALLLWASPIFGQGLPSGAAGTCTAAQALTWSGGALGKWVCVTPGIAFAHDILSVWHTDTTAAAVVRGDVVIGNATPNWIRLAKGNANEFLGMGAAGTDVAWAGLTLAGAQFVNQGTVTTLLHGNAGGNPSWSGIDLVNDTVANQGATTTLLHGNAAGQPAFGSVIDLDIDFTSFENLTFGNNAAFTWTFNDDGGTSPTLAFSVGGVTLTAAGANQDITLTPSGTGHTVLNGDVGIGTALPLAKTDIRGSLTVPSGLGIAAARPAVGIARIQGEISGIGGAAPALAAEDGFLRLSAGGGTLAWKKTFIDLSGWSNVPDMDRNIVFGTTGAERVRITAAGYVGIGTLTVASGQKLEINGGLNLTTATARPACDAVVRGTFWVIQSAAGVKDDVSVCVKDALNAYAWFAIY